MESIQVKYKASVGPPVRQFPLITKVSTGKQLQVVWFDSALFCNYVIKVARPAYILIFGELFVERSTDAS